MIKFELALKGMFRTDLVLGNDRQRRFGLIEFEDAEANSIFKRATAQCRYRASEAGRQDRVVRVVRPDPRPVYDLAEPVLEPR